METIRLGKSPPIIYNQTVAPLTRQTFASSLIDWPFYIDTVRIAFALNTARTLQVRVWISDVPAVANNVIPSGIGLFSGIGADDYVVGDGTEGELIVPIGRAFPGHKYVLCEGNNLDIFNHTLDVRINWHLERHEWTRVL